MEAKARHTRALLAHLAESFPSDASGFEGMKDHFLATMDWLKKLADYCVEEHHNASKATAEMAKCRCSACRADELIEVVMSLDRDTLMDIIVAQEAGGEEQPPCVFGKPAPQVDVVVETKEPPKNEVLLTSTTE
jgi:hypothetical protein